jgi:hypothetical protein
MLATSPTEPFAPFCRFAAIIERVVDAAPFTMPSVSPALLVRQLKELYWVALTAIPSPDPVSSAAVRETAYALGTAKLQRSTKVTELVSLVGISPKTPSTSRMAIWRDSSRSRRSDLSSSVKEVFAPRSA